MFQSIGRVHMLLAGATSLTFVLGVGVAVGAVPRPGTNGTASVHTATVGADVATVASDTPGSDTTAPEPESTEAPTTDPTSPATEAAAGKGSASNTPASPAHESSAPDASLSPAPGPAPAPPASVVVPRTNPTSAQVRAAISQIATRVPFFAVASEAQARQFGDAVCTAFDEGNSYAQVKAQLQQALSQLPGVTVTPADFDFAIRIAVELFCPGHMPKLG